MLSRDDPDPDQIVDVLESPILLEHLAIDRELVLRPPGDLCGDAGVGHHPRDLLGHLLDEGLALRRRLGQLRLDLGIGARIEDGEAAILELVLDLLHTETMGQRGIDVEGLAGDPDLLLLAQGVDCPEIVETVEELDDQDPDVAGHGDHHLADVGSLCLLPAGVADAVELGDPVDQGGDVLAEGLLDLAERQRRVLDGVVEEGRRDGVGIETVLGEHERHRGGVGDVGVAVLASLALVGAFGSLVGADATDRSRRPGSATRTRR